MVESFTHSWAGHHKERREHAPSFLFLTDLELDG